MSGNQEDDPFTRPDRPLEAAIDRSPSGIEAHSMEVEGPVRIDIAGPQAAVPDAVERVPAIRAPAWLAWLAWRPGRESVMDPQNTNFSRRFSGSCNLFLLRDSGRILAVTRAHKAASSGLSERTRSGALGEQDQGMPGRRHAAGQRDRLGPAPQNVSNRFGPLIAPPVSCATHRPLASCRSILQENRSAEGDIFGIRGNRPARRHRQRRARRAGRPRPVP